jgi:hypothetical protein
LLKPPTGKIDQEYAYVALSRATSLKNVIILRPFDVSMLKRKLCNFKIREENRLFSLSLKNV